VFWSLYGVWRRLYAERFEHYDEGWLWVPSLGQPNPDFKLKLDWLLEFKNLEPTIGWHDYLSYLIFPTILVGFTLYQQQQATATRPKSEDESQQLILQVLPFISVYFIGTLSLELPQAVSVYYTANSMFAVGQTALVKYGLRQEIPGYEEYEKTGKFPESAFDDMLVASTPAAKNIHEAALQGNMKSLKQFMDEVTDIDAWDDRQISPLGYAVACGNLEVVKALLAKGASLAAVDGQNNTVLHYAAGYGQKALLEELLQRGDSIWADNKWAELRNNKGQTVVDAARVNRKGQVLDFLRERLGTDVVAVDIQPEGSAQTEVVQTSPPEATPTEVLQTSTPDASSQVSPSDSAAQARAALLAAASAEKDVTGSSQAQSSKTADAMQKAIAALKQNPEQLEQARKMMDKMPPQMLSMLSGNKLTAEQAKKSIEAMKSMSTDEVLAKADAAATMLNRGQGQATAPKGSEQEAVPARSVD